MARQKVTIELEDDLVAAALQVARRRGISLRSMIRNAFRDLADDARQAERVDEDRAPHPEPLN